MKLLGTLIVYSITVIFVLAATLGSAVFVCVLFSFPIVLVTFFNFLILAGIGFLAMTLRSQEPKQPVYYEPMRKPEPSDSEEVGFVIIRKGGSR